jgi:hypothetical protein
VIPGDLPDHEWDRRRLGRQDALVEVIMKTLTKALLAITLATAAGCVVGEIPDDPGAGSPTGPTGPGGNGDGDGDGDGTGPGDGTGGGGSITATAFLDGAGMKQCDNAFACKSTFPTDQGVTFDQAFGATASACYTQINQYNPPAMVEAAITAGKIDFDGAAAKTCLAGIAMTACATLWANGPDEPAACAGVFSGKVADGAACTVDLECSGAQSYCNAGTCAPDTQQAP